MKTLKGIAQAAAVAAVASAFFAPQALAADLPASFDLRHADLGDGVTRNYVTSVKNQSIWGTCWCFAGIGAAESSILATLGQDATDASGSNSIDLSEHHLAWFACGSAVTSTANKSQAGEGIFPMGTGLDVGGSSFQAAQVFAQGTGVVEENANKLFLYQGRNGFYTAGGIKEQDIDAINWAIPASLRFSQSYELKDYKTLPTVMDLYLDKDDEEKGTLNKDKLETVKAELAAGHGVTIDIHTDVSREDDVESGTYMNTETSSLYVDKNLGTNHAVELVGWDDNYSASNFNAEHRPPGDGAWICKNSWGAKSQEFPNDGDFGIGGEGYFYVSYYDMCAGSYGCFEFEPYSALYTGGKVRVVEQNDYMSAEKEPVARRSDKLATMANVFTATCDESITHVSCVTADDDTQVTFEVYKLGQNAKNPKDGTLVWSGSETYAYQGLHKVRLGAELSLKQGERFSVVVTQKNGEGQYVYNWTQGTTKKYYKDYPESIDDQATYCIAKLNAGESVLYTKGKNIYTHTSGWNDFSTIAKKYRNPTDPDDASNKYYVLDNFPIKAYGNFDCSGISLDGAKLRLDNKTYTYEGNLCEPDVAVTTAQGKLVPKSAYTVSYANSEKVGKATITVTGANGCSGSATRGYSIYPNKVSGVVAKARKARRVVVRWYDELNKGCGVKPAYKVVLSYGGKQFKAVSVAKGSKKKVVFKAPKRCIGKKVKVSVKPYVTSNGKNYAAAAKGAKVRVKK